jgi:hypothetical protein
MFCSVRLTSEAATRPEPGRKREEQELRKQKFAAGRGSVRGYGAEQSLLYGGWMGSPPAPWHKSALRAGARCQAPGRKRPFQPGGSKHAVTVAAAL